MYGIAHFATNITIKEKRFAVRVLFERYYSIASMERNERAEKNQLEVYEQTQKRYLRIRSEFC